MAPKLIVVIGATGAQGSSVVKTFSDDRSWRVRAITRDVNSAKGKALQAEGIEVVAANLGDPVTLDAAFQNAHAIFSVTDFWGIYNDPVNQGKPRPGQAMNHWTYEEERRHGQNVFDAASKVDTLERLVFSGLSKTSKWSQGKFKKVLHFDSKAEAAEYGQETYPELWMKTSILQAGFYLENFTGHPMNSPVKLENGTYRFPGLLQTESRLPLIAALEDTGPLTRALVDLPAPKNLIAYREYMTFGEFIELWGKTLGVQAVRGSPSDIPDLPAEVREELAENFAYFDEFGYEGKDDTTVVHPKDLDIGINLGSVEEWIKAQKWSLD